MKQRAMRNNKKAPGEISTNHPVNLTEKDSSSPLSPGVGGANASNSMMLETPTSGVQSRKITH
jgi:hypothetical protein